MSTVMPYADLGIALQTIAGELPARHCTLDDEHLITLCHTVRDDGGHMLSLWGEDRRAHEGGFALLVALQDDDGLLVAQLPLPADNPVHPDLSMIFPVADHLQRANFDLLGIRASGGDPRGWLWHGHWPQPTFPLRCPQPGDDEIERGNDAYQFVRVTGDGVHEIAVGPVHAGIIEPGHFRFSVVGEKVLRLEPRLGYAHKGIEKRFESMALADAVRLAARVSGDSAAAYAWAFAMAAESLTATPVPARASALRALLLERERIANHLGDLGALGNDGGFAFGLSQFSRLKENLLRANASAFGARYPMDAIVPGGCRCDLSDQARDELLASIAALEPEVHTLHEIYANHSGLQDRFRDTGRINPALVERLGVIGMAARATGFRRDWRLDLPVVPYPELDVAPAVFGQGDVAARVAVRFAEVFESLRLCRKLLETLPSGATLVPLGDVEGDGFGIGGVEGWRGPVFVAVRADVDGRILRCHPHDPSWQNWQVIEHAAIDNIVPDFPLINKSFNLSYSGVDL
ncbi:NADH-quinone oxidoreductase subunit C [Thermomonas sp.]|uniref:hydrogenase large subunit n=1 Tax=Thermomonas sp. TaxID=1971895 RepID=UPI00248A2C23|nr:NADH-quinone oxidoreductase subunit C [Thermomonas sp.]MDI1253694.1 NADH-quinone oxidoreductase subunit C [Thermomonas sp.]